MGISAGFGLADLFGGGAAGGGLLGGLFGAGAAGAEAAALPAEIATMDAFAAAAAPAAAAVAPEAVALPAIDVAAAAPAAGAAAAPATGVLGDIGSALSGGVSALGQGVGNVGSSVAGALGGAPAGELGAAGSIGAAGAPGAVGGAGGVGAGGVAAPAAAGASTGDVLTTSGVDAIAPGGLPASNGPLALPGASLGNAPASLTGAPAGAGAAAPASSGAGALTTGVGPVDSTLSFLGKNPALLLGGAGLLKAESAKNKPVAGQQALELQALQDQQQGQKLQSYLQNGTLPPGVQAGLDQAHHAAQATIKSQYAARGQSGSSAEQQDLNNLAQSVQAQGAQIATGLLQTGIQESQLSTSIYEKLMQTQIQQDQALSGAIANFAGALAGGGAKALTT